jgi:hypothetical protein
VADPDPCRSWSDSVPPWLGKTQKKSVIVAAVKAEEEVELLFFRKAVCYEEQKRLWIDDNRRAAVDGSPVFDDL